MSVHDRLPTLSGAEIARLFTAGATDPVAVTELFLERIAAYPDRAVFISLTPERARAEATASAERYRKGVPLGPLDGVPVAWKDLVDVAGSVTTAASATRADLPPATRDAPVAANLAAAGMVCLGKTNLSEFAYSGLGLNPHFGTPINPFDKVIPRAPGGSSSGAGVAVAAGLAPIAIGTDTGGSVRVPAAFNGVVGYKTSEGRIDKSNVVALSRTLDTIGPLTRTVEDAVLLDAALRGAVSSAVRRRPLDKLSLIVPRTLVFDALEDAVGANFEAALGRLSGLGVSIRSIDLPALAEVARITDVHGTLTAVEAYHEHQDLIESPEGARIDRRVMARMMRGKTMSARDLLTIQRARVALSQEVANLMLDNALLAFPTVAHVAPPIAPLEADDAVFSTWNLKGLRNTAIGNFLGHANLAFPSGVDANGMPTSFLVSATAGFDLVLLAWGLALDPVFRDLGPRGAAG